MSSNSENVPAPRLQSFKDDGNFADKWKSFSSEWINYSVRTGLDSQPESFKSALLLNSLGVEGMRIFNEMKFFAGEDRKKMADILAKFDQFFLAQEFCKRRDQFHRRVQGFGESNEKYILNLQIMAETCGFCDCTRELFILDRLRMGIKDENMREKLLSTHLTLDKAIEICSEESEEAYFEETEGTTEVISTEGDSEGDSESKPEVHNPKMKPEIHTRFGRVIKEPLRFQDFVKS